MVIAPLAAISEIGTTAEAAAEETFEAIGIAATTATAIGAIPNMGGMENPTNAVAMMEAINGAEGMTDRDGVVGGAEGRPQSVNQRT